MKKMKDNPFQMADDIWGIGFKTADSIAEKMGIDKTKFVRLRSGIFYTLNKLAENGHCYGEREQLVKKAKELLEVEEGEIFGLLGPNGSGKSTTINCILALLKYDKGTVKVFGREMKPDSYDIKREIGVVMQDVAVFDELTVYENVDYFCGLYIRDKGLRKQYVEDAIAFVGLDEFRKFYPKKLSGGLLRRLNIACGIAHKPKLIFFDEPTVAVDPQSRNKI